MFWVGFLHIAVRDMYACMLAYIYLHFGFWFERDCLFPIGLLELESVSTFGLFVGLVSLGWVGPCVCITLSESMGGLMG